MEDLKSDTSSIDDTPTLVICECGGQFLNTKGSLKQHLKSKKHYRHMFDRSDNSVPEMITYERVEDPICSRPRSDAVIYDA